jgi:hypothetical protein
MRRFCRRASGLSARIHHGLGVNVVRSAVFVGARDCIRRVASFGSVGTSVTRQRVLRDERFRLRGTADLRAASYKLAQTRRIDFFHKHLA